MDTAYSQIIHITPVMWRYTKGERKFFMMDPDSTFYHIDNFDERSAIERARPVSPLTATRMLQVLKKDTSRAAQVTPEDIKSLLANGITWREMLEMGTVLMNSLSVFDEHIATPLRFEYGTLMRRNETGGMEEKPWVNQGGNEVHRDDRDMQAARGETGGDAIEDLFDPDPKNPWFVRLRGCEESAAASMALGHLMHTGKLEWDMARINEAAQNYRRGPREKE